MKNKRKSELDEFITAIDGNDEFDIGFPSNEELIVQQKQDLQDFNDLLTEINTTQDKLKSLWKRIYDNASVDRMNSYMIWLDLYKKVYGRPAEHAIHGQNLSRYLERMSKANDQLIKLSEQIANYKEKEGPSEAITDIDVYDAIEQNNKKH